MDSSYTHFLDLAKEAELPKDGILSRTLFNDDQVKAVLFAFAEGEELSEHSAMIPRTPVQELGSTCPLS